MDIMQNKIVGDCRVLLKNGSHMLNQRCCCVAKKDATTEQKCPFGNKYNVDMLRPHANK